MRRYVGLDFGTTNSALAVAGEGGEATLARFPHGGGLSDTFRSILYFDPQAPAGARALAGPRAIERYLQGDGSGRLIQSLKSYLASKLFQSTRVLGQTYSLEELIAFILRGVRAGAEATAGALGPRAVVGRPVRFSNAETPEDEALALTRLRAALAGAGFEDVSFEYEPVGAAWHYERSLDHEELVLIGDFGGGTSDFCLLGVGPRARKDRAPGGGILGTEGVGLAGDAFDSEVVTRVVSPRLGLGSSYRSYLDGKVLPVPPWLFSKLKRWHHLSFLKSRETLHLLGELKAQALEPERLESLLHLIEYDLGYQLYRSVEGAKVALSGRTAVPFSFRELPSPIEVELTRGAFEGWIAHELDALRACIDRLLQRTGVLARDVDRVFLTGGSSLVPAVRGLFRERFGEAKLRGGDELTSVALGLALSARDRS